MTRKITATELARNLSEILSRAQYRGESFVIERNGETVARLGPAEPDLGVNLRDIRDELQKIPRPDDKFADDLEAVHAMQGTIDSGPWPS